MVNVVSELRKLWRFSNVNKNCPFFHCRGNFGYFDRGNLTSLGPGGGKAAQNKYYYK